MTVARTAADCKSGDAEAATGRGKLFQSLRSAPLLLNGYALIASAGLTSVLGVVFWMIATRLFTPAEVGFGAALISSMTTIGYFAQMNLGSVLNRFLPTVGLGAGALVLKTYCAAATLAILGATAFALGIGTFAPPLKILGEHSAAICWFVLSTVFWTVFALQDAALAGLRKSTIVPIENALYSIAKIVCLVVLTIWVLPPPGGIYLAWTLPLIPVVVIVNGLILRHAPVIGRSSDGKEPDLKTIARFVGWDYSGSLALAAAFGLAPLMVLSAAGEAANAVYHIAWTITYSVYLIGRSMSVSLVTEGAADPARLRRLIADALCHTMPLIIGAVLTIMIAAPVLMRLFGQVYAEEGSQLLRVLILSCIPWAATTIFIAAARVRGQTRSVAIVQVGTLAVFVIVAAVLLPRFEVMGVALAWLCAHTSVFIGIALSEMLSRGPSALTEWILLLASSVARLVASARELVSGDPRDAESLAVKSFEQTKHDDLVGLEPSAVSGSVSDVSVVLYREPVLRADSKQAEAKSVLKSSTTQRGSASLKRNSQTLRQLAANERLASYRHMLPELVEEDSAREIEWTLETAIPGIDGRKVLCDEERGADAMGVAFATIAALHGKTAVQGVLDGPWADRWIEGPLDSLKIPLHAILSGGSRLTAIEGLRVRLRDALVGKKMRLGLGHGDFSPGNILFSDADARAPKIVVSGLIDWDNSHPDAPLSVDIIHLVLATRVLRQGEELGMVVRALVSGSGWTSKEIASFKQALLERHVDWLEDPELAEAMVLLTWLHHVAANLNKSERYGNSHLWVAANVDWVLLALEKNNSLIDP